MTVVPSQGPFFPLCFLSPMGVQKLFFLMLPAVMMVCISSWCQATKESAGKNKPFFPYVVYVRYFVRV